MFLAGPWHRWCYILVGVSHLEARDVPLTLTGDMDIGHLAAVLPHLSAV